MSIRVFLSFSGQDRPFARRLIARLQAQPLEVWDYSREDQEIHGGAELVAELQREIAACDVFVPLVSQAAGDAWYVETEVKEALAQHEHGPKPRVIPILAKGIQFSRLPEPFQQLKRFLHYEFLANGPVEDLVASLCRDLQVEYRPIPSEDPRFPVLLLLDAEIKDRVPRDNKRDVAVYDRLLRAVGRFREAFEAGHMDRACEIITYVTGMCEYEFESHVFYYPYVVRAVCALLLDRLVEVPPILDKLRDHPKRDEHYPALLGMLSFRRGAYHEASRHFHQALDEARGRGHEGVSALSWLLQTHVHLNSPVGVADVFERLDAAEVHTESERLKLRRLVAFAEARLGSPERARGRLKALIDEGQNDADVLLCYAVALDRAGQTVEARLLLERHFAESGKIPLYRQLLGSLCFRTGRPREALGHFTGLIESDPTCRQYYCDAMEVSWGLGDCQRARFFAEHVLTSTKFSPPATSEDFFIAGLANFILDRRERSQYDLERSGFKRNYEELLQARRSVC
jgi:tetratricopeptide (TPR) repeat protein